MQLNANSSMKLRAAEKKRNKSDKSNKKRMQQARVRRRVGRKSTQLVAASDAQQLRRPTCALGSAVECARSRHANRSDCWPIGADASGCKRTPQVASRKSFECAPSKPSVRAKRVANKLQVATRLQFAGPEASERLCLCLCLRAELEFEIEIEFEFELSLS